MGTSAQPIEGAKPEVFNGTGRRKESVARVFLRAGTGKFTVNGRPVDELFQECGLAQRGI